MSLEKGQQQKANVQIAKRCNLKIGKMCIL